MMNANLVRATHIMTKALFNRPAATVNLIGGRLCLDFINSVGARRRGLAGEMIIRDEKLHDCLDLLAWAEHAGAINNREARVLLRQASRDPSRALRVFRLAIRLRESLYSLFKAIVSGRPVPDADLTILNQELQLARRRKRIARGKDCAFDWQWSETTPSLDKILSLLSDSAAELLTRGDLSRLTVCGGDDCGWIFEDTSRNRSRHWCDVRDCGNRERVRRFRSRQQKRSQSHSSV
jgi:predicted RNA-binding Zn ribbon-like protein